MNDNRIYYGQHTKYGKEMFTQVFVCSQGRGGGGGVLSPGGDGLCPGWGLCLGGGDLCPGGLCPGGLSVQGGSLSQRFPVHLRQTAVRILLECILVDLYYVG